MRRSGRSIAAMGSTAAMSGSTLPREEDVSGTAPGTVEELPWPRDGRPLRFASRSSWSRREDDEECSETAPCLEEETLREDPALRFASLSADDKPSSPRDEDVSDTTPGLEELLRLDRALILASLSAAL